LVSDEGSIDFCCLPNFDSAAYFCSILDDEKGGFFKIAPSSGFYQSNQVYKASTKGESDQSRLQNQTNILKTFFFNQFGSAVVTDFMPINIEQDHNDDIPKFGLKIVRKVKALQGDHDVALTLKLTPNWARTKAKISTSGKKIIFEDSLYKLVLYTPYEHKIKGDVLTINFHLKENEDVFFGLSLLQKSDKIEEYTKEDFHRIYKETEEYWEWWISKCSYQGAYWDVVQRSILTLKLLIFEPTGAIVAASTTSLPEKIGGSYNWDYRFTWLRDASFTVYAFLGCGYLKEAERYIEWLENVCLKQETIPNIMYGIHGEEKLDEMELPHLKGYMNSKPVRIGNGASHQKQFDIFGEVLTAINLYVNAGGELNDAMKGFVKRLTDYCCTHWKEKDAGIWEGRGEDEHHTYSKLMCWAGVDRGIRIAQKLNIDADIKFWEETKEQIKKDILEHGYNKKIGAFVDTYGSNIIDASLLNIPIVGLLPADDPKVLSTIDLAMQKLVIDWFVLRTSNENDELKQGEGAFFLSTFWLIDNLSLLGRTVEAKVWLDKIIHDATPLGLYAEEFDPYTKIHLGNFPQAFTHLGLINSILNLQAAEKFGQEEIPTNQSDRLRKVLKSIFRDKNEPKTLRFGNLLKIWKIKDQ
jgi:alpha,alpha-trehalase